MKRFRRKVALLSCTLALAAGFTQAPADAYYYPFYYRGLSSLLYPLRYAAYPFFGLTGPYSPWTSASMYRRVTQPQSTLPGYPYMYGPQMMQNYQDPEPLNNPRKRKKQKRLGQEYGVDEVSHAQWANGEEEDAAVLDPHFVPGAVPPYGIPPGKFGSDFQSLLPGQAPGTVPQELGGFVPQGAPQLTQGGYTPQVAGLPQGAPQLGPAPGLLNGAPPMAPQVVSKGPVALAPNLKNANPTAIGAPLAEAFVNLINTKYEGDIAKALFDPQTRSCAKVLGMISDDDVFGSDLSDTRVELIKRILADKQLDGVSKLSAVKILLGGSANRAK